MKKVLTPTNPQISIEAQKAIDDIRKYVESLPEGKRPKVVINSLTYNHEPFIRETLDGFLKQKTNFPFVAVVHEDASTDGTAAILREYAEKYPNIIFPIFETENQYFKPGGPLTKIMHDACEATGAKYIAICEGDDYWTDPLKLQKQVDFLESHPDYVMCSHSCTCLYQDSGQKKFKDLGPSRVYGLENLAIYGEWLFQPVTIIYKSDPKLLEAYQKYSYKRDASMIYSILKNGKGYLMEEPMAVYRIHSGGVWSGVNESKRWDSEYSVRKGIYDVEKDDMAAAYLGLCLKFTTVSRRHYIKMRKDIFKIVCIINKHFGMKNAIRLLCNLFKGSK